MNGSTSSPARAAVTPPAPALRLVTVTGSAEKRAQQLGEYLAADPDAQAELDTWPHFFRLMLAERLPGLPRGVVDRLINLLDESVLGSLANHQDDAFRRAVHAFGTAAGGALCPAEWVRLHAALDGISVLGTLPLAPRLRVAGAGCSTLVVTGPGTSHGGLLHGRNFDLPLLTDAPAPPLLVVHRPDAGLRHVSLHHAPAFMPGITGTNEAGITVGVHQHFSTVGNPRGVGILAAAWRVIEQSRTLEHARDLLAQMQLAAGWCFTLSCARTQRAWALEVDRHGVGVHGTSATEPCLAASNCFVTAPRRAREYHLSGAWKEHTTWRRERLQERGRALLGSWDAAAMALQLGDHGAPGQERALGQAVGAAHTMASWVVSPGEDRVYVATGGWPAVHGDGYAGLRLGALLAGRLDRVPSLPAAWSTPEHATQRSALQAFIRGARRCFSAGDAPGARKHFAHAHQQEPGEPIYLVAQAVMDLRAGNLAAAVDSLEDAEARERSPYRRGLCALLSGRGRDVAGQRAQATQAYRRALLHAPGEADLLRRAQAGLEHPFSRRALASQVFDSILADVPT